MLSGGDAITAPRPALGALITDYLAHLQVERGLSINTLAAYTRDLARYEAYLADQGRTDLADVTSADVTAVVQAIQTGADGGRPLARSSASRFVAAVRGLHRFALREGRVVHDVAAEVHPPAVPRPLPRALDHDQVSALLDAIPADGPVALRDRALLELLYGTGIRISEAVTLAVDDLDVENRALTVTGKGSKMRVLPLGHYAADALDAWLVRGRPVLATRGRGVPHVFLNTLGRPLSRQSAWAVLHQAATRAGLGESVSPHTLRHTFATHLLHGGADVRVVQELLGHSSVTTTQIYTHVTIDALRETWAIAHPRAR